MIGPPGQPWMEALFQVADAAGGALRNQNRRVMVPCIHPIFLVLLAYELKSGARFARVDSKRPASSVSDKDLTFLWRLPPGRAQDALTASPDKTMQYSRKTNRCNAIATVFSSSRLDVRRWSLRTVTIEIPDAFHPLKRN